MLSLSAAERKELLTYRFGFTAPPKHERLYHSFLPPRQANSHRSLPPKCWEVGTDGLVLFFQSK